MPRQRKQSVPEAKRESIRKIESALLRAREGLRFAELRERTGLHQSTLTLRLQALLREGKVVMSGKRYELSQGGSEDLDRRGLLSLMESMSGLTVVKGGEALDPAEHLIRKFSVGYAFPGFTPGSVQGVMVVAHKFFMLHVLSFLIRKGLIDGKKLKSAPSECVQPLREAMKHLPRTQILAFSFNLRELAKELGNEYLAELIRVAKAESSTHIENPGTRFIDSWTQY